MADAQNCEKMSDMLPRILSEIVGYCYRLVAGVGVRVTLTELQDLRSYLRCYQKHGGQQTVR